MSDNSNVQDIMNKVLAEAPGLSQIKIRVDEATQNGSAIDVVRMITGQNQQHASLTIRNLNDELCKSITQLRINGKGKLTPVASAATLVEIIWELPGAAAKAFRRQSAHYICRILGGDLTLIKDIEARFATTSPATREFLTAHVERPVVPDLTAAQDRALYLERARIELDERKEKLAIEIEERRAKVEETRASNKRKLSEMYLSEYEHMERLGMLDDRDKIFYKDLTKSAHSLDRSQLLLTDDSGGEVNDGGNGREISIMLVCQELGIKPNGKEGQIGKLAAKAWRAKYNKTQGESPPKRTTLFRGKPCQENAYYQTDYELLANAVRQVCT